LTEIERLREEALTYKRWWSQEREVCRKARMECYSLQVKLDEANLAGEKLSHELATVEGAFELMMQERDNLQEVLRDIHFKATSVIDEDWARAVRLETISEITCIY